MTLTWVYVVLETTGCPEEGRPFESSIVAVYRTRESADQRSAALYGSRVEWRLAVMEQEFDTATGVAHLLAVESFSVSPPPEPPPPPRPRKRKAKRR